MVIIYAKYPHAEPIENAVKVVMSRQLPVRNGLVVGEISVLI